MNSTRPLRVLLALLTLLLVASACGADDDDAATSDGDTGPAGAFAADTTTVDSGAGDASAGDSGTTRTAEEESDAIDEVDAEMAVDAAAEDIAPPEGDDLIEPAPEPQPQPEVGLLTAADIDDNLNLSYFADIVADWQQAEGRDVPFVDLRDRVVIDVVGDNGVGVGNLALTITAGQSSRIVVTDSAGRAHVYPAWLGLDPADGMEVRTGAEQWSLAEEDIAAGAAQLTLEGGDTTPPGSLDVALVLDVTGSMADELRYLAVEFESIVAEIEADYGNVDLRFALVVYRDEGDDFVTRTFDFTGDVAEMRTWLASQQANGGGDFPEAMDAALVEAESLSWRTGDDVARVLVLNADAPPHDPRIEATFASARALGEDGVRIYPLAASGVDRNAEFLMRAMAVTTGGRHLFLTGDSGIGGEKLEPKAQCYVVTGLDDLLYRVFASELAGERIEPNEQQIIRTVGDYDRGVCA